MTRKSLFLAWPGLNRFRPQASLFLMSLALSGCGHAPSFNVLGSYFPAWMLCVLVAIVLTVITRAAVRRLRMEERLEPLVITYPFLTATFAFTLWLIFFS